MNTTKKKIEKSNPMSRKCYQKRTINNNSQTFTRNTHRETQRGYLRQRNLNCTSVSHSRQLCNTTPHFTYREYYLPIHFNTTRHFTYAAYYLHLSCNDLHIVAYTLHASSGVVKQPKRIQCQQSEGVQHLQISKWPPITSIAKGFLFQFWKPIKWLVCVVYDTENMIKRTELKYLSK